MNSANILDQIPASKCKMCKSDIPAAQIFCPSCGYPQHGNQEQKKAYYQKLKKTKQQLDSSKVKIYIIVAILSLIAGFNIFSGVILTLTTGIIANSVLIIVGLIFAGLAYWSLKKPISSIITGLSIIALDLIHELQYTPEEVIEISFMNFLRYLFITVMVVGLIGAIKKKKIEKELMKVNEV